MNKYCFGFVPPGTREEGVCKGLALRLEGKFALRTAPASPMAPSLSGGTLRWTSSQTRWPGQRRLILDAFAERWGGAIPAGLSAARSSSEEREDVGKLARDIPKVWGWYARDQCLLLSPLLPAAFWGKCRDVLQSPSSMARDSLPPCSSQPAGPSAGRDAVESSVFRARRKLLPPLPGLLDGGPKAFGVAGGYSPATSCRHTPPKTEMGFLRLAREMCLFSFLVHAAVGLT